MPTDMRIRISERDTRYGNMNTNKKKRIRIRIWGYGYGYRHSSNGYGYLYGFGYGDMDTDRDTDMNSHIGSVRSDRPGLRTYEAKSDVATLAYIYITTDLAVKTHERAAS